MEYAVLPSAGTAIGMPTVLETKRSLRPCSCRRCYEQPRRWLLARRLWRACGRNSYVHPRHFSSSRQARALHPNLFILLMHLAPDSHARRGLGVAVSLLVTVTTRGAKSHLAQAFGAAARLTGI